MNPIAFLSGYKTYIVAAATFLYAAVQWWSGALDQNHALALIGVALSVAGVRSGVATAALQILSALGTAIPAAAAHPAVAKALAWSKRAAPVLFVCLMVPAVLAGCSTFQSFFANGSGPIGDGLTVIQGAQAAYIGVCPAGSTTSYCVSSKTQAKSISAAVTLTATQLVQAYETNGNVTQLESELLLDITQWQSFVNSLNAKAGRKGDTLGDVVTILGVLIPVGTDVYNAIIGASGNYTTAQLNALITTIQSQNATIQSS